MITEQLKTDATRPASKKAESKESITPKTFSSNPTLEEIKKMSPEQVQALIRHMRDRDAELITGIFHNFETPASSETRGAVRFVYAAYPGETLDSYELWDGERYSLPRGLVRRLKTECYMPIYDRVKDPIAAQQGVLQGAADGRMRSMAPEMKVIRKKHRFGFSILDFMDHELEQEMRPSNIVQVTY